LIIFIVKKPEKNQHLHNQQEGHMSLKATSKTLAAVFFLLMNTIFLASQRSTSSFISKLHVQAFSARSSNIRRFVAAANQYPVSLKSRENQNFRLFSTEADTTYDPAANMQGSKTYPLEMTEAEKYLFDLNGYIIIRNVLTPEEIKEVHNIIDKRQAGMIERSEDNPSLRNAVKGTKFYGSGTGRKDLGGVLEWGPESKVFKSILAHPRLVPLFHGILGKGYRMDHLPFIIAQDKGAEGFQLHGGTVDCNTGMYNPELAYTCHNGIPRSSLLGVNVMLTDHDPGFGGFCVVPGSHKSNFKMPPGMVDGEAHSEFIQQPATKAGDVVLFSEGTVHGAMAWTAETQRRVCLYRFAPATNVYGRSYFTNDGKWPEKMYEDLDDAQRAVLEPPYANRLDRPEIIGNGSTGQVVVSSRNDVKKQHDQNLFGTKYF
jgi:ectoine hydroxylase-related dioxygenase (phytanoyl-CoA dioxygenase family)